MQITKYYFFSIIYTLLLFGCHPTKSRVNDDVPRRAEILFLGHASTHHNSRAHFPLLAAALTKEGINITYTENLDDLRPERLALFDGIIIYANHDSITQQQNNALLEFVKTGGAFIPIHSGSYCFRNSKDYVDLVGGQFERHDTASFIAKIISPDHPIMQGLDEFETWDETYVHKHLASDNVVLMERREGDHREPWTWVKEYGKGKVFYTAFGHDLHTWSHPSFHQLIKQGILWALEQKVRDNLDAFVSTVPSLQYEERDNIPNYEKRDPAPKYQLPLTPEESAKFLQVAPGFEVQLFASEPDIINPIAMNWDEKGRLWVIETVDYPNTVRDDKGQGDDRIKICEDTDGDGRADKFTIFADKLNIPTSFVFVNGGIIVSQAPYFLFLKDTDGDDIADVKEVIMDGWGVFDTHAGPSNLQYGIDNRIYGAVGYSGFKGKMFDYELQFRQGVYRFNRDYSDFEFLSNTSNNTWGLGLTEDNAVFASTANNTHSVFVGIPNRHFKDVIGIKAAGNAKIDGHYDMQAITPHVRQVDVFGGFTAAAGHHFYTARDFPERYWNRIAFICEPTGGVVHQGIIHKKGSSYEEKDGGNLLASSDEWFSPVEAKVGPDGNVWVLDWYNFIIQHNPTPRADRGGYEAVNGDGNAYINPLRDQAHGRIWRVKPKNSKSSEKVVFGNKPSELVKYLTHDNLHWRLTAQRLLVEMGATKSASTLHALVKNKKADHLGLNVGALHALWTLDGLGLVGTKETAAIVQEALSHPSPAVRKAALQLSPQNSITDENIIAYNLLNDPDPSVLLEAILYCAERPASDHFGMEMYRLSQMKKVTEDEWLAKAVYISATKHAQGFYAAIKKEEPHLLAKNAKQESWFSKSFEDANWATMALPQYIESAGLMIDGVIHFRKTISLTAAEAMKIAKISLGPVDDSDIVYINGQKIGSTEQQYQLPRVYDIPQGVLVSGENLISVRVEDTGSGGGIYGKPEQMFLQLGREKKPLHGTWRYIVHENYSEKSQSIFNGTSIASVWVENYGEQFVSDNVSSDESTNSQYKVVRLKTIPNEMKYDRTEFNVVANEWVELIFENNDFMQHNLVITRLINKDKVGLAADKMATEPKAAENNYIPNLEEVLFSIPVIDPNDTYSLKFQAPSSPGDYPYICTFPGHWRIMQGTMRVTKPTI